MLWRQQVAWNDESNPAQGFKYLYLTASDYEALEEGTVNAQEVVENGQKRYALTDIIGKVRFVSCPPIYPSILLLYCSARYGVIFAVIAATYIAGSRRGWYFA